MATNEPGGRKRDAVATRAAILAAAQQSFAERGYERATVRDIAARAGVNQALLFRYFGTKDDLFRAAIADRGRRLLADGPADGLFARLLARALVPVDEPAQAYWLQAALRSSGHESSASVIRRELGDEYVRELSALTDGPDGELRAELLLAWLLGIGLVRSVHRRESLASADPAAVAAHVLRAAQALLEQTDTNFPPR
ncbi:TetR/AcrR family transcriptional regulator [Nocardia sp. BMG51109]|uniref:TetR/AcrR family transcriptional regulator n=1 Tax=Nocardia sp. BMG51109 TaxID=1056816 RepID=UPI0004658A79|nr:TetR/AcrR family transcriptional regulator [Nocardia sp. BMG51109]